jgi:hypothetical protein
MAAAGSPAEPTGFGANPTWSYSDTGAPDYRLTYPYPACMQWFTFNNGKEGLYIGSHDKTLMTTVLNVADGAIERRMSVWQAGRDLTDAEKVITASIVKLPFVTAGETWNSEPVVVRLYRGDWHEAQPLQKGTKRVHECARYRGPMRRGMYRTGAVGLWCEPMAISG